MYAKCVKHVHMAHDEHTLQVFFNFKLHSALEDVMMRILVT